MINVQDKQQKQPEKKDIGITAKKEDNFSEWFVQIMLKAELADYSVVSGCMVLRPYSYAIWEKIRDEVDKRIKKLGVKNAYFPLFIPESLLSKEAEHVEGFAPEVAWVTHGGNTQLGEKLAVRPTSEAIMYDSYSKWIRSWRDLPLKLNQWNNVVRWEFKHPVPFLRTREFLWNEGHTVFATKGEADAEIKDILDMYKDIVENHLALYGMLGKKTDKEKFAGALATYSFEYVLLNGRAIQGPDAHSDGQNFAKAYDIKFLDDQGNEQYAWQNTWAITTRMLGVMFAVHSDNKGLVLPPKLAPIQAVIIPILFEETKEKVLKECEHLKKKLEHAGIITELDAREEYTPGWKFNQWELKGVPIRVEIGPKDVEKEQAVLARRDTGKKEFVKIKDAAERTKELLESIQKELFEKSKKIIEQSIKEVKSMEELKNAINDKKIALAYFCNERQCEDWIKDKTDGAKTLNMPLEQPSDVAKHKCVHCNKEAKVKIYFGKSY